MVDVVDIKNKAIDMKPGAWARVKRGKYQGDLCQIIRINDSQNTVRVKMIPRLDLSSDPPKDNLRPGAKRPAASVARPPQRLFNRREVEMSTTARGSVTKSRNYFIYNNEMFKDGFLEKDVKPTTLITSGVNPTYEEITNFANAFEDKAAKGNPPAAHADL